MKKPAKVFGCVWFGFLLMLSISSFFSTANAESLKNEDIEKLLIEYNETGYKFLEKLDTSVWKALYAKPKWNSAWEVVITSSSDDPEKSMLVVGTTVLTAEKLSEKLLLQLLDENSYDSNPGNYSIFVEDGIYFIQYAFKMPQSLINEQLLKETIGFVAAYSNSRYKALEALLPAQPASEPAAEPAAPAPTAPVESGGEKTE